jgi:hypothetical protein
MSEETFATAINCMDGRTQDCVSRYLRERFGARFVDTVTEPGPDGILAGSGPATQSIRDRVAISVGKHRSRGIGIVAHDGCAGNPVSRQEHERMVRTAICVVQSWGFGIPVVGLYVAEGWDRVELIDP